jgi:dTDP-glucose 4,6-dehydratase
VKILVPGCAGFIGYHLCSRLLEAGHSVIGLDNFASGQRQVVADLSVKSNFQFIEHDLCEPLPELGEIDQIYNMACPASPTDFRQLQLDIMRVCSQGVWNLLDLARSSGARLLHTSTSEVYGDPLEHPQRESYWGHVNPIGPRACYDEGKRFAEALLTHYVAHHTVQVRIVRIFNTYGPRMRSDDGRALPTFISQALANEPITVHGDGSQTRSFCYVEDQVEGLMRLMASEAEGPVNIGNPVEVTMRAIAEEVIELCESSSTLTFVPRPQDDPNVRKPDIARAQRELGWQPKVDRREGLQRTIAWFRASGW